jgi:hypothetical protein
MTTLGSFYSSVRYNEGKSTLHGPFHNVTEETAIEMTKAEADKARVIAKIVTRPVRSKAVLAALDSAPTPPPVSETLKAKAKAPRAMVTAAKVKRSAGKGAAHAHH